MAKRVSVLNGTNNTQDYDLLQWQTAQLPEGVLTAGALAVSAQGTPDNTVSVAAGVCLIEVTRTSDGKTFKLFGELTAAENVTILDTGSNPTWIGSVVATIDKASVQDGSSNAENGTGIFELQYVAGQSTSPLTDGEIETAIGTDYAWIRLADVTQDPTVASGDISDQRLLVGAQKVLLDNDDSLRAFNASGIAQEVLKLLTSGDYPEFQIVPRNPSGRTINQDLQLIDKKYFDDNTVASGVASVTLGETVAIGDALRIKMDGKAYKCSDVPDIMDDSFESSRINTGLPATATGVQSAIHRVTTDKWLLVYYYVDSGTYYLYGKVGTLANGKWTWGSATNIYGAATALTAVDVKKCVAVLTSGIVYFAYGTSSTVYSKRCTISGTTLTAGSQITVAGTLTNPQAIAVAGIQTSGSDYAVVAFHCSGSSPYDILAYCGNGTAYGGGYTIFAGTSTIYWDVAYNKEQQVLFTYSDNTDGDINARTVTQTINTTTLTVNAEVNGIVPSITAGSIFQLERIAEDSLLLLYEDTAVNELYIQKIAVSSTTPSLDGAAGVLFSGVDSATKFTSITSSVSSARLSQVDDSLWGVVMHGTRMPEAPYQYANRYFDANNSARSFYNANFGEVSFIDVTSDPLIKKVEERVFYLGGNSLADLYYENGENEAPYLLVQDSQPRMYGSSSLSGQALRIDLNHFIGWAQSAGVLDDVINADSAKDNNQSGLTTGRIYSLGPDGDLVLEGTGKKVAMAISATQVVRYYP